MKALVIGAAGFVGGYLIDELIANNYDVVATKLPTEEISPWDHSEDTVVPTDVKVVNLDILVKDDIQTIIEESRPDAIYHLAAQSSVSHSWENPYLTVDVNIKGTLNLLEVLKAEKIARGERKARMTDYRQRLLLIGSGEEYGKIPKSGNPISENTALNPGNIYAVTKSCQNMLGRVYSDAYDLDIIMVRAFNHAGPGQSPTFVISDFCKQVAEIEAGIREPVIKVGNLSAKRDFTDVRDVVRAYVALTDTGKKGDIYNVGSGKAVEIGKILDIILAASTAEIKVQEDKSKLRPVDVPIIEADIRKLTADTEWLPAISLERTIIDTLQHWRSVTSYMAQRK